MALIRIETSVRAPIERCFDLARSIDLHVVAMSSSGEEVVAGVTTGLIGLHQEVTWRGRHFGVRQSFTSRITAFDRPAHFQDSMIRGAFRRFVHDHRFTSVEGSTLMEDVVDFAAPLGFLGRVVEGLVLNRYMMRLIRDRADHIKRVAEGAEWSRYLIDSK